MGSDCYVRVFLGADDFEFLELWAERGAQGHW